MSIDLTSASFFVGIGGTEQCPRVRHATTSVSIEHFGKDRSMDVSGHLPYDKEPREVPPARLFASFNRRDQLAARRLILPSASEVSLASAVFSSSSVFCRMLAQSLRPSCRAHAIRLP